MTRRPGDARASAPPCATVPEHAHTEGRGTMQAQPQTQSSSRELDALRVRVELVYAERFRPGRVAAELSARADRAYAERFPLTSPARSHRA